MDSLLQLQQQNSMLMFDRIQAINQYHQLKQIFNTAPNAEVKQMYGMKLEELRQSGRFDDLNQTLDFARSRGINLSEPLKSLEGDLQEDSTLRNLGKVLVGQFTRGEGKTRLDPFTTGVIGALDDLTFGLINNNYYDASTEKYANTGRTIGAVAGLLIPGTAMVKGAITARKAMRSTKDIIDIAKGIEKAINVTDTMSDTVKASSIGKEIINNAKSLKSQFGDELLLLKEGKQSIRSVSGGKRFYQKESEKILDQVKSIGRTEGEVVENAVASGESMFDDFVSNIKPGNMPIAEGKKGWSIITDLLSSGKSKSQIIAAAKKLGPDLEKAVTSGISLKSPKTLITIAEALKLQKLLSTPSQQDLFKATPPPENPLEMAGLNNSVWLR